MGFMDDTNILYLHEFERSKYSGLDRAIVKFTDNLDQSCSIDDFEIDLLVRYFNIYFKHVDLQGWVFSSLLW